MYNQYRNNMSGTVYDLYTKPMTNGKYMINAVNKQLQLSVDQKNDLVEKIFDQWNTTNPLIDADNAKLSYNDNGELSSVIGKDRSGGSRRRRPSRKYKKSKRMFRKKSRSTRRR